MAGAAPVAQKVGERPLFRGYALVYFTCAWLLGDWLSGVGALADVAPLAWLALTGAGLALIGAAAAIRRWPSPPPIWRKTLRAGILVGVTLIWMGLGAARAAQANPMRDPHTIAPFARSEKVTVTGDVSAEPDTRDGYELLTVQVSKLAFGTSLSGQPASGLIEATVYGPNDWFMPTYGDTVTLSGVLKPVSGGNAPTDISAKMPSARARVLARGGGFAPLAALFQARLTLAEAIERTLPGPEAALLIGILLGMKSPALRARLPLFVDTGTIHLVVPAGLKVSLLAEFASRRFRRFGVWPRATVAMVAVGAYAALGGSGPAAIRAAIMGGLLALAPALGRVYNVYTALALATLIMTVVQPALLYDAGFQLTALATFALPLLTPAIQQALLRPLGRYGRGAFLLGVAESLAVTLAAQIATLPTLALTFHVISLIAPLANLFAVPFLAPLLVVGGLLAIVATLGWSLVALALSWVVWPMLWVVNAVITACASAPFSALQAPSAPPMLAAVYYGALIGVILLLLPRLLVASREAREHLQARGRSAIAGRTLAITLGLALLGSMGASAPALASSQRASLDFLDVGPGGSAALLRLPGGASALIDGGPSGPTLETALSARLPFWQRSLSAVVLTDGRAGDARGIEDIATSYTIAHALDAGMRHPTTEYLAYLDALRHRGVARQQIRMDDTLTLDAGTMLTVLSPPSALFPAGEGDTVASDDLIVRLQTPGLRVLLLGAADGYALDALAGSGEALDADVVALALPRGAPIDLTGPLGQVLRLAHPRVLIVTDAPVSTHPHTPVTLSAERWANDADVTATTGAQVYRLSATGALSLSGDANGWSLG